MNDPVLTVIIPTYNRRDTLLKCLKALTHQSCSKECFEIILVDDGSTDGTDGAIHSWMDQKPCDVKYFQQENRGPAAARNVGIRNAKGQVLLFLGDDVIPNNNLLEEHMEWHKRFGADNSAMLGFVTWSPELEITPFMQWLENGGPQFSFRSIKDKNNVNGAVFFYTSNISVKRCFLLENDELFDEDFPYAAHEDSELGYRLSKKGLMLTYNENAIGYHHHYTSLSDSCKRMIKVGESQRIMEKKTGRDKKAIKIYLLALKFFFLFVRTRIYYPLARYYEKKEIKPGLFKRVLEYYTFVGYSRNCK